MRNRCTPSTRRSPAATRPVAPKGVQQSTKERRYRCSRLPVSRLLSVGHAQAIAPRALSQSPGVPLTVARIQQDAPRGPLGPAQDLSVVGRAALVGLQETLCRFVYLSADSEERAELSATRLRGH